MVGLISRLMLIQVFVGTTAFALTTSLTSNESPAPENKRETKRKIKNLRAEARSKIARIKSPIFFFEGYSKIMIGDKHIGYTIQRFEFDPKKKEYSTIYVS